VKAKLDEIIKLAKQANEEDRYPCVVELLDPYRAKRPKDVYAWALYSAALDYTGRFDESESALLQALKLAPPSRRFIPQTSLALLYHKWGKFDKAELFFSRACRSTIGKKQGHIWILRGVNYLKLLKFNRAEKCLLTAIALNDSDKDEAYLNLGAVFIAQRKYKEAANAFKKALKISPRYKEAKQALNSLKDISKAIQIAKSIK
jgi:tetratricopeptide (TPR) repeat protein